MIDTGAFTATSLGTPQGGVISPLLANIALHGMEERIKKAFPRRKIGVTAKGGQLNSSPPDLIRYADDFVILHEDITVVQRCREIISEWLNDIGLELKPSKTRLTHTLESTGNEPPGFNFLGFNIRQYKENPRRSGVSSNGIKLGYKTIITTNKEKVKEHDDFLTKVVKANGAVPQAELIKRLNPIIRGWANYYSTVVSSEVFHKLDSLMYGRLRHWATNRHSRKGNRWITNKYWQTIGGDNWVFATREAEKNPLRLIKHSQIKINRYVKVKGESSP